MGRERDRAIARGIQALNVTASIFTLLPFVAAVGAVVLTVLQQPAVALLAALLTGVLCVSLIGRRAAHAGAQRLSNARIAPLLRAALVSVVEAGRVVGYHDPARGAPSSTALTAWSPNLSAVDRVLRRADFEQELLTYLLWLVAELRRASVALSQAAAGERSWRDEWLVVRERLAVLGCLLVAEAKRREIKDVVRSFAGNPHITRPGEYGDRTMTAANDIAMRGAPPFPADAALTRCAPDAVVKVDRARGLPVVTPSIGRDPMRAIQIVIAAGGAFVVFAAYPIGSAIAFWLMRVFGLLPPSYEWVATALAIASLWWVLAYGATALVGGVSFGWAAWSQLEDAVLHFDPAAASAAPILNAVVSWWSATAVGFLAGWAGGQPETAAAIAFLMVNLVAGIRLVTSRA